MPFTHVTHLTRSSLKDIARMAPRKNSEMKIYFLVSSSVFVICLFAIGFFSEIISRSDFGAFLIISCLVISLFSSPIFLRKWLDENWLDDAIKRRGARTMHKVWRPGWTPIEGPNERAYFNAELAREIPQSHILFGEGVHAIGRRVDRDDLLFELADGRIAEVHLTWAVETSPDWPSTQIYNCFETWLRMPDD